jgi:hypothetical protein
VAECDEQVKSVNQRKIAETAAMAKGIKYLFVSKTRECSASNATIQRTASLSKKTYVSMPASGFRPVLSDSYT